MRRVRVAVDQLAPGERTLPRDAAHYLIAVHRSKEGDSVVVFDPERRLEADAELIHADERRAVVRIHSLRPARAVSPLCVTLLQGFGKGDKVDQVVRDTTALGVSKVVIVETARSVVRLESERAQRREERWRKIAAEAARQSGRGDMPEIVAERDLSAALSEHGHTQKLRFYFEPRAASSFASALATWRPELPTAILIGPEGGLTEAECAVAAEAGFVPVRLGAFTLRTETAATVVLGALFVHGSADYNESTTGDDG